MEISSLTSTENNEINTIEMERVEQNTSIVPMYRTEAASIVQKINEEEILFENVKNNLFISLFS